MTLLMVEPCETDGSTGQAILLVKPWSGGLGCTTATGRTGNAWQPVSNISASQIYTLPAADNHATMVVGFALKWGATGMADGDVQILAQFLTSANGAVVRLEAVRQTGDPGTGSRLRVVRSRDGTILATTTEAVIDGTAWYYVELKVVVGASGSFELRTNEVTRVSGTGVDTLPTTGTTIGKVGFRGAPEFTNKNYFIDDIYTVNGAGSVNNDFLGDTTVHRLFPTAAGDLTQFTPSTGSNWSNVDDIAITTDYNEATVITFTDLYNFANLPAGVAGNAVHGLIAWGYLHSVALPRGGALLSRVGITDTVGATITLTTTATGYNHVQETKPGGGAWATTDVDSAQHGVKVIS